MGVLDADYYKFDDIDLEIAVQKLEKKPRTLVRMLCAGFGEEETARVVGVNRYRLSTMLYPAMDRLSQILGGVPNPRLLCRTLTATHRLSRADWSRQQKQSEANCHHGNLSKDVLRGVRNVTNSLAKRLGEDRDDLMSEAVLKVLVAKENQTVGYYVTVGKAAALDYLRSPRSSVFSRLRYRHLSLDYLLEYDFEVDTDYNITNLEDVEYERTYE